MILFSRVLLNIRPLETHFIQILSRFYLDKIWTKRTWTGLWDLHPSKPTSRNIHNPSDIIRYSVGSPFFLLSKLCEIEIFGLLKLRILSASEHRGTVGIRPHHFLQATLTQFQAIGENMPTKV